MSAFVVETELLDFLLTFMQRQRLNNTVYVASRRWWCPVNHDIVDASTRQTATDWIGQILHAENVRSVNHRYYSHEPADLYRFREHPAALRLDPLALVVQVLKCCACYDYQACETDDYAQTDAARIIQDIRTAAIHALPGYDAAKWGAPEAPPLPAPVLSPVAGHA